MTVRSHPEEPVFRTPRDDIVFKRTRNAGLNYTMLAKPIDQSVVEFR
jgi:hypothetical protein